jgi:hypothetical protein
LTSNFGFSKRTWTANDCPHVPAPKTLTNKTTLHTIALILIIAWLLGLVSSYTMGGFIHILLVVAIVVLLLRLIQGKRV